MPQRVGYGGALLKLLLSLGVVCVVAFVALKWGLRRFAALPGQEGPMKVLARMPLEPRRALLVVKVHERALLLASSEAGVSLLTELTPQEAAAMSEPGAKPGRGSGGFAGALKRAEQRPAADVDLEPSSPHPTPLAAQGQTP